MSSEMTLLRKEDLSLYYYIKDIALCDFFEQEFNIPVNYISSVSTSTSFVYEALTDMVPKPTERGRGWVYFDTSSGTRCIGGYPTVEQSNRVVVYDADGNIIPDTEYMLDYLDGRVITSGTLTGNAAPASVDYYWYYVSIVDEWAAVEAADPPVVVIDIFGTDKGGYQLGAGKKVTRKVDIHIFATSTAERNDLVDKIYDNLYLITIPMYDFPQGGVLDYDGTFYNRRNIMDKASTPFDNATVSGILGNMYFDKVTSRNINLPLIITRGRDEIMLSDLNAYRSKISFDMTYYTEV